MDEINFYTILPKKRVAAAALFFNRQQKILIVKPVYQDHWLLPGGVVEKDESPRQACTREIEEELGLKVMIRKLLCIDYKVRQGAREEGFEFVFFGGIVDEEVIEHIQLQAEELGEARFVDAAEAMNVLNPWSAKRLPFALKTLEEGTTAYLENGQEVV